MLFLQEIARHLRSQTLRARFGIDKIKNAVHCTDLPDDALLEVSYFNFNGNTIANRIFVTNANYCYSGEPLKRTLFSAPYKHFG